MNIYPPCARIAGRYEVASRPLMGGMGIVYLCFDHQEQHPVALKTFRPEFLPDRAARDRFLREGTTWVNLGRHPHIVCAYGVERIGDGREVYLVLELVAKEEGRQDASLRSWLVPGRPLPVDQALLFGLQIARGMGHATAIIPGFVHRDLKPENVLVGADRLSNAEVNRLRVTDFGLAAVLQEASQRIGETALSGQSPALSPVEGSAVSDQLGQTQLTRGVVGTPLYMAPEQWQGKRVDVQTDVYALGCILYEMLAGQRAVGGRSLAVLKQAHCAGELRPLPVGLPEAVGEVVARCLAVEPEARYGSWGEVEEALGAAYAEVAGQATPGLEPMEALSRAEQVAAGWSYNAIGASYLDIGKAEIAQSFFERAQQVGSTEREQELEVAGLNHLGLSHIVLGNAEQAIKCHEQALTILHEVCETSTQYSPAWAASRYVEGAILGNLGIAYARLGDTPHAIKYYEQQLIVTREVGDQQGEMNVLNNLGLTYYTLSGDARRAIAYYEQSLAIAGQIGDRRGEGNAVGNLGLAYAALGNVQQAIRYYNRRLEIACEIGDRRGEGTALCNLGLAYTTLGDAQQAFECYKQQLEIAREINDQRSEGDALGNLGMAYYALGDLGQAIGHYEQSLAIARETGDRRGEGKTLNNLGLACTALGDAWQAIKYHEQALAIAHEIGNSDGVARNSFNMASLYTQQGETRRALPLAEQAAEIWGRIGSPNVQAAQQLVAQVRAALR